ncbi:MAG: hydroxymethylbilane synthase [Pseudomonadota bacterium]
MRTQFAIGTRGSLLAVAQAQSVQAELSRLFPQYAFPLRKITTTGDLAKNVPLGSINLKGVFTKELDEALLAGTIDLAVHSLKDLPSEIPPQLSLQAVTRCLDPRDAVISKDGRKLSELPAGAKIGTSSLRRGSLIREKHPSLAVALLRGNVDTRIRKLDRGEYAAILVAAAGLKRLGREERITEYLDPFEFIPAIGQGMLAVVARRGEEETAKLLFPLDDAAAHRIADGERRFMRRMEGGCQVPMGCYGEASGDGVRFVAYLATPDAKKEIRVRQSGKLKDSIEICDALADEILAAGGGEILREIGVKL